MGLLMALYDTFWDSAFWLPANVTWADLKPNAHYVYPNLRHLLYYPLPTSLVVLLVRYTLERFVLEPIGVHLCLKGRKVRKAPSNDILEKAHQTKNDLNPKRITGLAKQLDWPERKVERWLRIRRVQDRPTILVKFCESSSTCVYYIFSFVFGLFVLWDKPWLWDIRYCYVGFPLNQSVTDDIWWYCVISISFCWSRCISQFFDVKRKDFWQMFTHHIATVSLMSLTWICNLYRVGTLILLVHDCADILLDAAKVANYAGCHRLCEVLWGVFTMLWIVTRIGIFPFWIIHSTLVTAPAMFPVFPAYYIFISLLIVLLGLHIFWTYLILRMVYNSIVVGRVEKDIRSSSSEEISESDSGSQSFQGRQ